MMHQDVITLPDVPVLFGRFLVLSGLVSETDIVEASRVQKDLNASPMFRLIEQGILTMDEVKRARAYQWERMATFCQALDALGIMVPDDCAAALESVNQHNVPLGEVLVRQGKITREALMDALERHRRHQISNSHDMSL